MENKLDSLSSNTNLTCVDELDVSLQVAVDHENLVAAGMGTGSFPHVLVMLLDVFLKKPCHKLKLCDVSTRQRVIFNITELAHAYLQAIRSSVDRCTALIRTLVDVRKLLS